MTKAKQSGSHSVNEAGKSPGGETANADHDGKKPVKSKEKEERDSASIQKNLDRYRDEMAEDAAASGSPEDNP